MKLFSWLSFQLFISAAGNLGGILKYFSFVTIDSHFTQRICKKFYWVRKSGEEKSAWQISVLVMSKDQNEKQAVI